LILGVEPIGAEIFSRPQKTPPPPKSSKFKTAVKVANRTFWISLIAGIGSFYYVTKAWRASTFSFRN
jgi:hypothetical protein